MPQLALTDLSVRALKPSNGQITYWDTNLPNFGVRVGTKAKTFVVLLGTERQRVTLGRYPAMSLAKARQLSRERSAEQTLEPTPQPITIGFADALSRFFATHSRQNHKASTARENARILNRHFLSRFQGRRLADVTTAHLLDVLDDLQDTPSEHEHAFRVVRTFFNFCLKRGYLETSPMARLEAPRASVSRDRVLSNGELSRVWAQAQALGYPYGTIVQLLILTGEVAALQWDWIDESGIALPASLTKNGRASRIPYSTLTHSIIATVPRKAPLLFPARGYLDRPFKGFGVRKIELDKCGVENFTHHDLRRTYATNMAALGTPIHVLEKLLNHSAGAVRGVAAIYNRHTYWDEMCTAVTLWENHCASLLKPATLGRPE
jgi:integrase